MNPSTRYWFDKALSLILIALLLMLMIQVNHYQRQGRFHMQNYLIDYSVNGTHVTYSIGTLNDPDWDIIKHKVQTGMGIYDYRDYENNTVFNGQSIAKIDRKIDEKTDTYSSYNKICQTTCNLTGERI